MHAELYPILEALPDRPGARLAVAAPRGSAKSTLVSLIFLLWVICHRKRRFVVLISDTADKAGDFLEQVKHELVHNERLLEDYPEVCERGGRYPRPPRWRSHEIITHNQVKVLAMGWGQNIRGRRHIENRPDLILLDDVESRENTHSPEARAKLDEWFNKSVLKAGTKETQVIIVGTIQHYDSLLAKLTDPIKRPMWEGKVYRSVEHWSDHPELWQRWSAILHQREQHEGDLGSNAARRFFEAHREEMISGTQVLWPEAEDYYALMLMRESDGPASFDSEKQNEPVNPQDCFFLEEDFQFWDERWPSEQELIASLGKHAQFVGACDPSLGRQGKHADDSAIITLLRDDQSGRLYVLDADIARRKPDRILDDILAYARYRKYDRFGFETNQFQSCLAEELKRRSNQAGVYLPVQDINHTSDKLGRIQGLQPWSVPAICSSRDGTRRCWSSCVFSPRPPTTTGPTPWRWQSRPADRPSQEVRCVREMRSSHLPARCSAGGRAVGPADIGTRRESHRFQGGKPMRIYKLSVPAQRLVQALDSGEYKSTSVSEVIDAIQAGTIFDLLRERLDIMVPLSMLTPVDKLELLIEWADFELAHTTYELGVERNGLCLVLYYLLESILRRSAHAQYRLTDELAVKED